MPKMMKLYKLNMEKARGLNIGHFNPTCKAILKAMYRIEKMNTDHGHSGTTGEDILRFAVKTGLWITRQAPEKYHTTWAYYVKKLTTEAGVYDSGKVEGMSTEEYLDQEDDLLEDEPEDIIEEDEEDYTDGEDTDGKYADKEYPDEDRKVTRDMDNMKANREDYDNEQSEAAE